MLHRLVAVLVTGLVLAPAASAATVDVPSKLAKQIDRARTRSGLKVLLPSRVSAPMRVYGGSSARRGFYSLDLGFAPGCNTATACFFADFLGERTKAKAFGDKRVTLTGGRSGWYTATHCGASCAAPQVQWRQGGVLYTLQVKGYSRRQLIAAANSAIRGGAR